MTTTVTDLKCVHCGAPASYVFRPNRYGSEASLVCGEHGARELALQGDTAQAGMGSLTVTTASINRPLLAPGEVDEPETVEGYYCEQHDEIYETQVPTTVIDVDDLSRYEDVSSQCEYVYAVPADNILPLKQGWICGSEDDQCWQDHEFERKSGYRCPHCDVLYTDETAYDDAKWCCQEKPLVQG